MRKINSDVKSLVLVHLQTDFDYDLSQKILSYSLDTMVWAQFSGSQYFVFPIYVFFPTVWQSNTL